MLNKNNNPPLGLVRLIKIASSQIHLIENAKSSFFFQNKIENNRKFSAQVLRMICHFDGGLVCWASD